MKVSPAPIDSISYSQHASFQACPLKLAFQRDPSFDSLRKPLPASLLGLVAHGVTERILSAQLDGVVSTEPRKVVAEVWEQECQKHYGALSQAWGRADVPVAPEWSGYAMTRTRVLRHLVPKVWFREAAVPAPHPQNAPKVEQWLSDSENCIQGIPDLIESRLGEWWILDLKSGLHQAEPTESQRVQLLLYAHLFRVKHGALPDRLAVVTAAGAEFEVTFDDAQVEGAVQQVRRSRELFNQAVNSGGFEKLASASEEHCNFCPYRVACDEYFSSVGEDWRTPNTLRGTVLKVVGDGASTELTVEVTGPELHVGTRARVIGVTLPRKVLTGEQIALSNFTTAAGWTLVRGRWNTLVHL